MRTLIAWFKSAFERHPKGPDFVVEGADAVHADPPIGLTVEQLDELIDRDSAQFRAGG